MLHKSTRHYIRDFVLQVIFSGLWFKTNMMFTPTSPVRDSTLRNTLGLIASLCIPWNP